MNNLQANSGIAKYFPEEALPFVEGFFREYQFNFRITKKRFSKLGDFRVDSRKKIPSISVNGNLNPYQFLFTFLHEIAHLIVHVKWETRQPPHGDIWKDTFREILLVGIDLSVFPEELSVIIKKFAKNPKASTSADAQLLKALHKYDKNQNILLLEDIPTNQSFALENGRRFVKGVKRRTRYLCLALDNRRKYLISGTSQVQLITN